MLSCLYMRAQSNPIPAQTSLLQEDIQVVDSVIDNNNVQVIHLSGYK